MAPAPADRRFLSNRWKPSNRTTSWCGCFDEEQAEIHRILVEMTRRIGEHAGSILAAAETLAELELQFAKARFAEEYNCVPVVLSRKIRVGTPPEAVHVSSSFCINARHPLLERNLKAKGGHVIPTTDRTRRRARRNSSSPAQTQEAKLSS